MTSMRRGAAVLVALLSTSLLGTASAATCNSVSAQCGDGYTYDSLAASTVCAGVSCVVGTDGAADQAACCTDQSGTCSGTHQTGGAGTCVCDAGSTGSPTWEIYSESTAAVGTAAGGSNAVNQKVITLAVAPTVTIKAGQAVSGTGIPAGAKVASDVDTSSTTLTLDTDIVESGGIAAGTTLTFDEFGTWDNIVVATVTAATAGGQTSVTLASAITLVNGMIVTGDGIASGTTVANGGTSTSSALTLSTNVESGGIAAGTTLTFQIPVCTAVVCPEGSTGTVPGTSGMNGESGCKRVAGWSGTVVRTPTAPFYVTTMAKVACPEGSTGTGVPGDTGTDGTSGCTAKAGYLGSVTATTYVTYLGSVAYPYFVTTLYMTDAEAIICGGQVGCDGKGCSCVEVQGMFAAVVIPLIPVVILMFMFMYQTFGGSCTGLFGGGGGNTGDGGVELADRPTLRPTGRPPARNPAPARSPRGAAEEASDGNSSDDGAEAARGQAVDKFVAMGFSETAAKVALRKAGGNEQKALNSLLTGV